MEYYPFVVTGEVCDPIHPLGWVEHVEALMACMEVHTSGERYTCLEAAEKAFEEGKVEIMEGCQTNPKGTTGWLELRHMEHSGTYQVLKRWDYKWRKFAVVA